MNIEHERQLGPTVYCTEIGVLVIFLTMVPQKGKTEHPCISSYHIKVL